MIHDLFIFLGSCVFIYLSLLLGEYFFRLAGISFESKGKHVAYAIMAGYGIFGIAGTLFVFVDVFNDFIIGLFSIALVFLSLPTINLHCRTLISFFRGSGGVSLGHFFSENFFLKALIIVWLFFNLILVFVPITGNDSLQYHLPIIKDIIQEQGSGFIAKTGSIYSAIPFFGEIFYAVPLVLFGNASDPFIFQVLQYSFLLIFLLLAYETVRPFIRHSFLRLLLIVLILSLFDFQREVMHGGYVDVFGFLFSIGSMLLLFDVFLKNDFGKRYFFLSAFFLGIALSIKYTALFFVLINGLFLVGYVLRQKIPFRKSFFFLSGYAIVSLLVSGFWYVKNAILFGNPVYPLFSLPETGGDVGMFIMERTIPNLFLFPWRLFGEVSATDSSSKLIVIGYLLVIYLFFAFFLFVARKRIRMLPLFLFLFVHAYIACMFFFSHQIRFLLPAIILLPLLVVLLCEEFLQYSNDRLGRHVHSFIMRFILSIGLVVSIVLFLGNIHYFHVKFLYKIGSYTKAEYIQEIGGQ